MLTYSTHSCAAADSDAKTTNAKTNAVTRMTCPSRLSEFIPKAFDCITAALRSPDETAEGRILKLAPRRQEDLYEVLRACSAHPVCREYCICGRCIGRLGVHSKNPERFELRTRDVEGRR